MNADWMKHLTEGSVMFHEQGPFFISLLFLLIGSTIARKAYKNVCERKEPVPTEKEVGTYRAWFIFSFVFGSALTLAGVVYWFKHEPIYAFSGVIQNLNSAQTVWGDRDAQGTVYIHRIPLGSDIDGEKRNDEFLIVRGTPFRDGEEFDLHFMKKTEDGSATRIDKLPLKYSTTSPELEIQWNPKTGKNELVSSGTAEAPKRPNASLSLSLISEARADMLQTSFAQREPDRLSVNRIIDVLQGDRVYVGSEISALDAMLKLAANERLALVANDGMSEPVVITLLDLTRHSDAELAYKAKLALSGVDVAAILRTKLTDVKPATRARYSAVLLRLPTRDALAIVNSIPKLPAEAVAVKKRIASNWTPRLLAASATSSGDRYWFAALWNRGDSAMTACVSRKLSTSGDFVAAPPATGQAIFTLAAPATVVDDWMLALSGAYGQTHAFYTTSFQEAFNSAGKARGLILPDSRQTDAISWKCNSVDPKTNTCTSTIAYGPNTYIVKRDAADRTKLTVSLGPGVSGYSHSKDWVLKAADEVENCGAVVSFTHQ